MFDATYFADRMDVSVRISLHDMTFVYGVEHVEERYYAFTRTDDSDTWTVFNENLDVWNNIQ